MSGAVRDKVVEVFDHLWQEMGFQPDRLPTGVKVREEVAKLLRVKGREWPDPIPSERMVQLILAGPRETARGMGEIDVPWSLAWGMERPDQLIPQDAIPDLIELAKYGIIVHRPFTVRQARWAARLRLLARASRDNGLTPHLQRISALFDWSVRFAGRQRRAELTDVRLDTADLDHVLALDPHLHWAAILTGYSTYRTIEESERERETVTEREPGWLEPHIEAVLKLFEDGSADGRATELLSAIRPDRRQPVLELWRFWLYELEKRGRWWRADVPHVMDVALELLRGIVEHEAGGPATPRYPEETHADAYQWEDRYPLTSPLSLAAFHGGTAVYPYVPWRVFEWVDYDPSWLKAPPPRLDDETTEGEKAHE